MIFKRTCQFLILGSAALGLCACQENGNQKVEYQQHDYGGNDPVVISSRPNHDRGALSESDRQLDGTDWRKLEQRGPQPVWDPQGRRLQNDDKGNIMGMRPTGMQPPPASTQPSQMLFGVREEDLP